MAPKAKLVDILEHHGIKGMRWGVRRSHPIHEDAAKAKEVHAVVKKHKTSAVSNEDLKKLTERMQLEQNYSNLSSQSKRKGAGAKFASDILTNVAKQQVSKLANDQVTKLVSQAIK